MLRMQAQLLRCWVGAADGGPDPIYPADFEGFLNHPFHDALAVVGKYHRGFFESSSNSWSFLHCKFVGTTFHCNLLLWCLSVCWFAFSLKSDTVEGWPDKVVGVAVCAGEMRPSVDISVEGTQVAVSLR